MRAYLADQVETERYAEARLRDGDADGVHDTRVAVRRIRSLLRVFPALDPGDGPGDGLAERLRAWSDTLGDVRDVEVLRETLAAVGADALCERLALDALHAGAAARLTAELDSAEHRALLEALRELALRAPADKVHPSRGVRRADRTARKRLRTAQRTAQPDPALLHRARKAAKRARYAAEAVGDRSLADHHERVQDVLGEHHDCVVALERLRGVRGEEAEAARTALQARAAEVLARLG